MNIAYYAWVRQKVSCQKETLNEPSILSLHDLILFLQKRGEPWNEIFSDRQSLRFAVNGVFIHDKNHPLSPHDNLSIFPPFTGG